MTLVNRMIPEIGGEDALLLLHHCCFRAFEAVSNALVFAFLCLGLFGCFVAVFGGSCHELVEDEGCYFVGAVGIVLWRSADFLGEVADAPHDFVAGLEDLLVVRGSWFV